jgi:KaiC/GvpD/RAD55 family RecA-like ATPase
MAFDAHAAIAGHEGKVLAALGIAWPSAGRKHIKCPLGTHEDNDPSWRWDDNGRRWYCTCGEGHGSIFDAVMQIKGIEFKEAVSFAMDVAGLSQQTASVKPQAANGHANGHAKAQAPAAHSRPAKQPAAADLRHFQYGAPSRFWTYQLADYSLVEVRARYDGETVETLAGKAKEVIPWRWNGHKWVIGQMAGPRPLYRLPDIATDREAPILVTEGEKAADKGQELFQDYIATTASGGAKAHAGMDWSVLKGRDITIWPDNDEEGRAYAQAVATHARNAGAACVRIVQVPESWPHKCDLADELPDSADLREMLDEAKEFNGTGDDPEFPVINAAELVKTRAPKRQWLVENWIPHRDVSALGADGGTGKSLLALQLAVAVAASVSWMCLDVRPGPALYVSAEDDKDELHYRIEQIVENSALPLDLSKLTLINLAGKNAILAVPGPKGLLLETDEFAKLDAVIAALKPRLVVFDSLADFFGGNEIDRAHVRGFVTMLRKRTMLYDCAGLLLIHPSVDGMKTGRGYSGSTHWNNAVRSRMYMTVPGGEDGDEPDPDLRMVELMKVNRTRKGQKMWMRFKDGIFEPEARASLPAFESQLACENQLLKLVRAINESGREVSPHLGRNYMPSMAAKHPESRGYKARDYERAMETLLGSGKLKVATYGPPSKQRSRLEIAPC